MKPETLVGKEVKIVDRESIYFGHYGVVKMWDGDVFHVEGGSISRTGSGDCPVFDRDQLKIRKKKEIKV